MYKLTSNTSVMRLTDNACIPTDPANRDYAEYLEWLAEGNTPEPVDQPTAEQIQAALNAESLAYLASTDWYIIRQQETGVEVPADILEARQAARDSIV